MSVEIDEKVLAAFQAEHKEQLEGIRALLGEWEDHPARAHSEQIDEAFRLAHSLKGGARVCDLHPAETMAHCLETVFEQVRSGTRDADGDVIRTIHVVLDAIEDWMAAIDRGELPPSPEGALTAVEQLINGHPEGTIEGEASDNIAQRLFHAFCRECPPYLAGLQRFAGELENEDQQVSTEELEEAYRLAHNLRGSAQAANIGSIEQVAEALESLIEGFRDQTVLPDTSNREKLAAYLSTIDQEFRWLAEAYDPATSTERGKHESGTASASDLRPASPGRNQRISSPVGKPAATARNADTLRISTESLDKLLQSSRQLVTESLSQEQVCRDLEEIQHQIHQMKAERDLIRHVAGASLHRLTTLPEAHRLATYFDSVDRGIQSLERATRQLGVLQKRNSWQLQSRSRQIQQEVRSTRMVPAEAVYQGLRKLVRDLAKAEGKEVEFRISGFEVRADRMVFQTLKDPLIHMLRNSIVHGLEAPDERTKTGKSTTCRIDLRIETTGNRLTIEVEDDGRGIDGDRVMKRTLERDLVSPTDLAEYSREEIEDLIFQSGFSTMDQVTEIAGRGMGLCVVRDTVQRLQGEVRVLPKEGPGTKFRISVPLCISAHRLLLVSAGHQKYAIPINGIERLLRVPPSDLEVLEGRPVVSFQDQLVSVLNLESALGAASSGLKANGETLHIAILKSGTRFVGVSVDAFLAERNALIEDLDGPSASKTFLGAILLEDGSATLVLNPTELFDRSRSLPDRVVEVANPPAEKRTPRVLVVDDSFTTRTLEKSILEANGYQVGLAVDGVEGLQRLKAETYDLVISDVEMPRMDGFTLLEEIKKDQRLSSIPVIMVTSRMRREDQERGLDLGAEAYIVKQKFDHQSLLSTIRQIVDM